MRRTRRSIALQLAGLTLLGLAGLIDDSINTQGVEGVRTRLGLQLKTKTKMEGPANYQPYYGDRGEDFDDDEPQMPQNIGARSDMRL